MSITQNQNNNNANNVETTTTTTTTSPQQTKAGLWNKVKKASADISAKTVTSSKNTKESISIQKKQLMISNRKKQFGMDYLDLMEKNATLEELEACVADAMEDIAILKAKVAKYEGRISTNKELLERKLGAGNMNFTQPSVNVTDVEEAEPMMCSGSNHTSTTTSNREDVPDPASSVRGSDNNHNNDDDDDASSNRFATTTTSPPIKDEEQASVATEVELLEHYYANREDTDIVVEAENSAAATATTASHHQHPTPSAPFAMEPEVVVEPEVPAVMAQPTIPAAGEQPLPGNGAVLY